MNDENSLPQEVIAIDQPTPTQDMRMDVQQSEQKELTAEQKKLMVIGIIVVVLIVVLIGVCIYYLLLPSTDTERIRNIFIIFMALASLLVGLTFVVLMVQLARFINLLNNEVQPILQSTDETVSNLRGTTEFLSDNLVKPVIKMNEYISGILQLFQTIGLARKTPKSTTNKGE
jgi:membrane-anchored glycerophosphoryl diester phosphodiesterase (GDPDase)